jgi:hypothetical protein
MFLIFRGNSRYKIFRFTDGFRNISLHRLFGFQEVVIKNLSLNLVLFLKSNDLKNKYLPMKSLVSNLKSGRSYTLLVFIINCVLTVNVFGSNNSISVIFHSLIFNNQQFTTLEASTDTTRPPFSLKSIIADVTFTEMASISLTGVSSGSVDLGDYDNDGDLDILLTGIIAGDLPPVSKIYRNDGNDTFTEVAAIALTGVGYSSVQWGDYDNDGDLDILLSGLTTSGPVCKIYLNNGNSTFTEQSSISLTGVGLSSVRWGDYDNDGDLDILITGNSNSGAFSKIYRNDRNNTFTEQNSIIIYGVSLCSADWGDYDNDGDLDILLAGNSNSGRVSKVYRNEGNNTFSEQTGISLTSVSSSTSQWGDYDGDGDLDILLSGDTNSGKTSKIYRNDGNNIFTDQTGISLTAVGPGSAGWGDYDNDGDLDLMLTGATGGIPSAISKIYRNDGSNTLTEQNNIVLTGVSSSSVKWGDYDNDGDLDIILTGDGISKIFRNNSIIANTTPNAPIGLTVIKNGTNVTLTWTSQGDAETTIQSLTYNVRVGTTPGGTGIVSPHALGNGKLTAPAMGNAQMGTSFNLLNLKMGTYYWSVQAVDNGYKGSSFATEGTFTLVNAVPTAEVNSAANITLSGAILSGIVTANNATTTPAFEYGTIAGDYANWKSIAVNPGTVSGNSGVAVSSSITGLSSSTTYYFRLKATNSVGTTYSSEISFSTPPQFTELGSLSMPASSSGSSAWGDYDNDGDLDILITGVITYDLPPFTKLYRNDGNNVFTEQTQILFTGIQSGSAAWGDYDKDGFIDILLSGLASSGPVCKIYRNGGNNTFIEQSSMGLPGISQSCSAWGDYDNDGDLDILLTGNSTAGVISKIYRNNGSNTFTDLSNNQLIGVSGGSEGFVQWGDYDNDGDLDILLTGSSNSGAVSKIYRNDGDNGFNEQTSIILTGVHNGSVQWGDYDSDGDLDILLSGTSSSGAVCKIYRNEGNNTFTEQVNISLIGIAEGTVVFGDYDNDGDLDILLTGYCNSYPVSRVYRNDGNNAFTYQSTILLPQVSWSSVQWGDCDNDGDLDFFLSGYGNAKIFINNNLVANSVPNIPSALTATQNGKNVTLSWTSQGDNETSSQALTYNVRVGTTPGGSEIVRPNALSNGKLTVPSMGNAQLGTSFVLKNIVMGTYYWSVQAVDNGYKGSSYSAEGTFTLVNAEPTVTINNATGVTLSGAALSGLVNANNATTTVTFEYGTTSGVYDSWQSVASSPASLTGTTAVPVSATLNGLTTGTTYYYRLKAVNSLGTTYSSDMSFSTIPQYSEVTGLSLTGISNGAIAWGDYDNDGDMDILLTGLVGSSAISKIYRNEGNDIFVEQTSISLTGVGSSSVQWGDYDNDGDLDILITGINNSAYITKIYRNNGNNTFTEQSNILLANVGYSSAAWGDYDNDGDLDILLTGSNISGYVSRIFRNDGNNIFVERSGISILDVGGGSVQWGDYDNDGDLDILLTGNSNQGQSAKIYRNDGNETFTEMSSISLTGVYSSSAQWGDFDSDGDLDILLTGENNGVPLSKIYRNEGNNGFAEQVDILLTGVSNSSVRWGDYDNDGDLDILIAGWRPGNSGGISKIYRNEGNSSFTEQPNIVLTTVASCSVQWCDYDNDGDLDILLTGSGNAKIYRNNSLIVNTAPNVPTGLSVAQKGKNVVLSWTSQGDNETALTALTYNVKVGTTPGGSEIVSPHALKNGRLTVPEMGNAQLGSAFNLNNLPFNTYYWSVQAVDNGYKGSPFSTEATFKIGPEVTTGHTQILTESSVTLNGTVNPKGFTLDAYFKYGLSPNAMNSTASAASKITAKDSVINVSATITGISPVTYYYCLYAGDGSTVSSGSVSAFNMNSPRIVSSGAVNVTTNSASLVATVNPMGSSTTVVFEYGSTTDLGGSIGAAPSGILGNTDLQTSATIFSLNKNTIYYYRAKATSSNGTNYSSIKQFVTQCDDNIIVNKPGGSSSICQGTLSSDYTTNSMAAKSYIWEIAPASAGAITGTGSAISVVWNKDFAGIVMLRVRGENGTCQSIWSDQLAVSIKQGPSSVEISGIEWVCKGQQDSKYSVTLKSGINYTWDVSGGAIVEGQGTGKISVLWNNTSNEGSVNLTQELLSTGCSITDTKSVNVTEDTPPAVPEIKKKGRINLLICLIHDMNEYQWYLNNNPIEGATGQYFEARAVYGNYVVRITDSRGCFTRSGPVSVGPVAGLVVYPNPSHGEINFEMACPETGIMIIRVIDSFGVIRYVESDLKTEEKLKKSISLKNLAKGAYLLDIEIKGEKITSNKILIL